MTSPLSPSTRRSCAVKSCGEPASGDPALPLEVPPSSCGASDCAVPPSGGIVVVAPSSEALPPVVNGPHAAAPINNAAIQLLFVRTFAPGDGDESSARSLLLQPVSAPSLVGNGTPRTAT